MPHKTVLLAVKEFVDTHKDFSEDYFSTEHRPTIGFFNSKVYLSKVATGWQLVELNPVQIFMHRLTSIISFGFYQGYGSIAMSSFKSEMLPSPKDESIGSKIKRLYEALMTKALGRDKAWTTKIDNSKTDLDIDDRTTSYATDNKKDDPIFKNPVSLTEMIDRESYETNPEIRAFMQKKVHEIALNDYKNFFHSIDEWTNTQRASIVRLLSNDTKLSLGIWDGVMHHGKAFDMSTREYVRTWIRDLIRALSLEQLKIACSSVKFWEVVGLFPEEMGAVLSVEQWQSIIDNNKDADLIGRVMLTLPVDDLLYDKLLMACGKIPIDFGKEFAMNNLIIRLSRYLKENNDSRPIKVLTDALKKAPVRKAPLQRASTVATITTRRDTTYTRAASSYIPPTVQEAIPTHSSEPQWGEEEFADVASNLEQRVKSKEEAKTFFWEVLCRFATPDWSLPQASLKYLIRHYPESVFGQIDDMSGQEFKGFMVVLEQTQPKSVVGVFDSLMTSTKQLGFSNELFARNKAHRILECMTPELLKACITEDKLRAALEHYADIAGSTFGKYHLQIIASKMNNPFVLSKIVSNFPLDENLGDRLAVICSHMVKDDKLLLQVKAKLIWLGINVDKNRANDLDSMIERVLNPITEEDEVSGNALSKA